MKLIKFLSIAISAVCLFSQNINAQAPRFLIDFSGKTGTVFYSARFGDELDEGIIPFYNLSDCADVLRTVSNGRVGVESVNFAMVDNMPCIKFNSFYNNTDRRYNLWLRGNPNYNMSFCIENCHQDMFRKILFTDVNRLILQNFELHAPLQIGGLESLYDFLN